MQNIQSYQKKYSEADGYISSVFIRYDRNYDVYQRTVYSILDWLGAIGGLQGALVVIGGLFVNLIAAKIFMSKIVSKNY